MGLYGLYRDVRLGGDIVSWLCAMVIWAVILYFAFLAALAFGLVFLIIWTVRASIRRHRRVVARTARAAAHPPRCPTAARYLRTRLWTDPRTPASPDLAATMLTPLAAQPEPKKSASTRALVPTPAPAPRSVQLATPRSTVALTGGAAPVAHDLAPVAPPSEAPTPATSRAELRVREGRRGVSAPRPRAERLRRPARPRNPRATWSLVFGLSALVLGISGFGSIIAIAPAVAAFVHGRRSLREGGAERVGRRRAVWSFALAGVGAALWCLFAVFLAL